MLTIYSCRVRRSGPEPNWQLREVMSQSMCEPGAVSTLVVPLCSHSRQCLLHLVSPPTLCKYHGSGLHCKSIRYKDEREGCESGCLLQELLSHCRSRIIKLHGHFQEKEKQNQAKEVITWTYDQEGICLPTSQSKGAIKKIDGNCGLPLLVLTAIVFKSTESCSPTSLLRFPDRRHSKGKKRCSLKHK